MSIILQILLVISHYLIGSYVLSSLKVPESAGKIGVAFLVGTIVTTYFYFLLHSYTHLVFDTANVLFFHGVFLLLGVFFVSLVSPQEVSRPFTCIFSVIKKLLMPVTPIVRTLQVLLIGTIVITCINNLFWPIVDWDAIALYDFRAVVLAQTGDFTDGIRRGYFLQYPPYTSILHTFSYVIGFAQAKIWYSLMFLSFVLAFYSLLRRQQTMVVSLLGCVLLASSPLLFSHAQMAYTNLPYAIFISLGFLYLFQWARSGKTSDLLCGSILTAASTWIRLSEPFWFFSVFLIIVGLIIHRKSITQALISLLVIYVLKYPWLEFVSRNEVGTAESSIKILPTGASQILTIQLITNVSEVYEFLMQSVYPVIEIYIPPLILTCAFLCIQRSWNKLIDTLLFLIPLGMVFVGTLIFSFSFPEWRSIPDSAARMSMFIIPLIIFFITNSGILSQKDKK